MSVQQAIITLVAAILSGMLATIITICVFNYKDKIRQKQTLVDDIFGFRYQLTENQNGLNVDIYSQGFSRAMNRIPIIFDKEKNVLDAYDKFYDTLTIADLEERNIKTNEALIVF